jgi:hypothetical protein
MHCALLAYDATIQRALLAYDATIQCALLADNSTIYCSGETLCIVSECICGAEGRKERTWDWLTCNFLMLHNVTLALRILQVWMHCDCVIVYNQKTNSYYVALSPLGCSRSPSGGSSPPHGPPMRGMNFEVPYKSLLRPFYEFIGCKTPMGGGDLLLELLTFKVSWGE